MTKENCLRENKRNLPVCVMVCLHLNITMIGTCTWMKHWIHKEAPFKQTLGNRNMASMSMDSLSWEAHGVHCLRRMDSSSTGPSRWGHSAWDTACHQHPSAAPAASECKASQLEPRPAASGAETLDAGGKRWLRRNHKLDPSSLRLLRRPSCSLHPLFDEEEAPVVNQRKLSVDKIEEQRRRRNL